jgi:hypothetical protein
MRSLFVFEIYAGIGMTVETRCPDNFTCESWVYNHANAHLQVEFPDDYRVPETCDRY